MTVFEQAKQQLNIIDVAEFYGLSVNRHKKALCPFHDDTSPSMSFKNERFRCFACGASGDVIELAQGILGLSSPLDALKQLNTDFALGIDAAKTQDRKIILRQRRWQAIKKAFELWEKNTFLQLADLHRLLLQYRRDYAPATPDEPLDKRFIISLKLIDYVDYLTEILRIGTFEEKIRFFKDWRV